MRRDPYLEGNDSDKKYVRKDHLGWTHRMGLVAICFQVLGYLYLYLLVELAWRQKT